MSWSLLLTIAGINVAYVSLFTLRMMLVLKGRRVIASILSMLEVYVYIIGLTFVLRNLDHPIKLASYCIGMGIGVYLGSRLEEYLALGYVTLQVMVQPHEQELSARLRRFGYGVTSWLAEGKEGKRLIMQVLVKRRHEQRLVQLVNRLSPGAFVVSYEPKDLKGGFFGFRTGR